MSANPDRTARVYETTPARLFSLVERQAGAAEAAAGTVGQDLADGVEAIHQIANLAGYTERPRAFVLALASAAFKQGGASVELFDEELADLQNCSVKTVGRQRADYLREARRPHTPDLVGIEEGDYRVPRTDDDRANYQMEPTRYTLHLTGVVEAVVAEARSDPRWAELDRKTQRDLLKRVAARVYDDIPDARRAGRKRRRPRLASAVVETHRKAADTQLRKLREVAAQLSATERGRLFDDPGELRGWWLKVRAEMDVLCDVDSPHPVTPKDIDRGGGQFVQTSDDDDADEVEPSPEAVAAWEHMTARLEPAPAIRTVEVELRPPE